jgi:lysophospholipase L1-like esterase
VTNILLFGDSISAGQYVEPKYRFSESLRNHLKDEFANVHLDVVAKSGQTTRQALLHFPEYINEYPVDILFVQLGINDANYWQSEGGRHPRVGLRAFTENCKEIVDRAMLAGVGHVRLFTSHKLEKMVLINGEQVQLNDLMKPYNDSIIEICHQGLSNLKVFDFQKAWCELPEIIHLESLLPNDGVHLSVKGHKIYSDLLAKLIRADTELNLGKLK